MERPVDYDETSRCGARLDACLARLPDDIARNIMSYTYANLCEARDVCQDILDSRLRTEETVSISKKAALVMVILACICIVLGLVIEAPSVALH